MSKKFDENLMRKIDKFEHFLKEMSVTLEELRTEMRLSGQTFKKDDRVRLTSDIGDLLTKGTEGTCVEYTSKVPYPHVVKMTNSDGLTDEFVFADGELELVE